jgi:transposase-like protein
MIENLFRRFIKKDKFKYTEAKIVSEMYKAVIACPQCKQKLRVPVYESKKLRITCSKCNKEFVFDSRKYRNRQRLILWGILFACLVVLVADIIAPIFIISKRHNYLASIKSKYEHQIKYMQDKFVVTKEELKSKYDTEVKKINPVELRGKAVGHYEKIWEERKGYNTKYAITPREKSQLEMLALSKDKTKSIEDIIKRIAIKAAPRNSTMNVFLSGGGYNLDIDFDMSELSSGEEGARTKHNTVDSLKKDVVRLISKVTNDVYQFCQDLDLESISIGCRHFVRQYNEYKTYIGQENKTLYKIRLEKKNLKELRNNPFLDTYSTTKYFTIEVDNFSNITISMSQS